MSMFGYMTELETVEMDRHEEITAQGKTCQISDRIFE